MPREYLPPRGRLYLSWKRYLLSKVASRERRPFDPSVPVFFVKKKMFALFVQEADGCRMNLKCIPDWSRELRRDYPGIQPGHHMNKVHWNTVALDGSVPRSLVKKLVDCSYALVAGKPKKKTATKKATKS
jgi:predicted DNA-binding protein (MmcQ/YjbR family)